MNNAVYQDIEDVVAFVKWLDDELCFLVSRSVVLLRWIPFYVLFKAFCPQLV